MPATEAVAAETRGGSARARALVPPVRAAGGVPGRARGWRHSCARRGRRRRRRPARRQKSSGWMWPACRAATKRLDLRGECSSVSSAPARAPGRASARAAGRRNASTRRRSHRLVVFRAALRAAQGHQPHRPGGALPVDRQDEVGAARRAEDLRRQSAPAPRRRSRASSAVTERLRVAAVGKQREDDSLTRLLVLCHRRSPSCPEDDPRPLSGNETRT